MININRASTILSKISTYLLSLIAVSIFCLVSIPRFLYPYEVVWMEGSVLEQIWRLNHGLPLYCAPSIEYVPWLYQPVQYYLTYAITSITGLSFVTARIPSVLSALIIVLLLYSVVKKETTNVAFSIAAVGLFLGAYGKIGFSIEPARVDTLFTMFLLSAFIALYYSKTTKGIILSILLFILSYYTKQTTALFLPAMLLYIWKQRGLKQAILYGIIILIAILIINAFLDSSTDGWYSYYTLKIPQAKRRTLQWEFAIRGFIVFVLLRCWLVSSLVVACGIKVFVTQRKKLSQEPFLLFGLFFMTGITVGFIGILNEGGAHNVMQPAAVSCAIFLPLAIHRLAEFWHLKSISTWLISVQILQLISFPFNREPDLATRKDMTRQEQFLQYAASLNGDIWIPYHGYMSHSIGKNNYAEPRAISDVLLVGDQISHQLRYDLDTALANHHWSYILNDFNDSLAYYYIDTSFVNLNKTHVADERTLFRFAPQLSNRYSQSFGAISTGSVLQ
jgi:hypothetical protein